MAQLAAPGAAAELLDLLVEVGDSVMTQRRRYKLNSGRLAAIELLALDEFNPRSIRYQLDEEGHPSTAIISYAAKYSSAFYGPFRDAADSAPAEGDRRGYQLDPANSDEAVREARLDLEEGADALMVKPAAHYLDVVSRIKRDTGAPVAAYQVSGEYSMLKAASANGWIDERAAVTESLVSTRRAGADFVVTYFAKEAAPWLV